MIQQPSKLQGRTIRGTMDTIHVVKRVKLQNIVYKTSKIVCDWGFTPNPTGRAYTAPSHHLVSCMGIAIHIPPPLSPSHNHYLMSNVPFLNNAKIAYGPETWLRHTLLPPSYLHYKHRPMVLTPVYYNFDAPSYATTCLQV